MWQLWIYHTFTTHDSTSELVLLKSWSYSVQIRAPKNEEWGKQLLHSCKVLLFFFNESSPCLISNILISCPHLQEWDKTQDLSSTMRRRVIVRDRYPAPLPFHLCLFCAKPRNFWDGDTAVWRINVLWARHDGGFAVPSRAFVLSATTETECWFLPAVLLQSVSFLDRVKNGRSNLGARSLALVPTHRGGEDLGPRASSR